MVPKMAIGIAVSIILFISELYHIRVSSCLPAVVDDTAGEDAASVVPAAGGQASHVQLDQVVGASVEHLQGGWGQPPTPDDVQLPEAVLSQEGGESLVRDAGVPQVQPLQPEQGLGPGQGSDDSVVQIQACNVVVFRL